MFIHKNPADISTIQGMIYLFIYCIFLALSQMLVYKKHYLNNDPETMVQN